MTKPIVFILLFSTVYFSAISQRTVITKDSVNTIVDSSVLSQNYQMPKNEISLNLLDFIISHRVEGNYERFLGKHQSVAFGSTLFDYSLFSKRSFADYIRLASRNRDDIYSGIRSFSLSLNYIQYIGNNKPNSGFFISPVVRSRLNQREESYSKIDENTFEIRRKNATYWGSGIAVGCKVINNNLTCKFQLTVLKNFLPADKNSDTLFAGYKDVPEKIEPRLYCGLGFRL